MQTCMHAHANVYALAYTCMRRSVDADFAELTRFHRSTCARADVATDGWIDRETDK